MELLTKWAGLLLPCALSAGILSIPFCRFREPPAHDRSWTAALWIVLTFVISFYAVGAAVNLPHSNVDEPLGKVFDSIDWTHALQPYRNDYFPVIASALIVTVLYTLSRTGILRLGLMIASVLGSILFVGPRLVVLTAWFAPLSVISALTGNVDGEFYVEDMPEAMAIGLWTLLGLTFAIRQLRCARPELRRLYLRTLVSLVDHCRRARIELEREGSGILSDGAEDPSGTSGTPGRDLKHQSR